MAPSQLGMFEDADLGVNPKGRIAARQAAARAATGQPDAVATFTKKHHRRKGKLTSNIAAAGVAHTEARGPNARNCQGRILTIMAQLFGHGATSDDLAEKVDRYAWQRLTDLETFGFIRATSRTKPSAKGKPMTVYALTTKGWTWTGVPSPP